MHTLVWPRAAEISAALPAKLIAPDASVFEAALDTAGTRFSLQKASMQCTASTHLKRVRLITLFSVLANRRCCLNHTSHMVVSMQPSCAAIAMAQSEEVQAREEHSDCCCSPLVYTINNREGCTRLFGPALLKLQLQRRRRRWSWPRASCTPHPTTDATELRICN